MFVLTTSRLALRCRPRWRTCRWLLFLKKNRFRIKVNASQTNTTNTVKLIAFELDIIWNNSISHSPHPSLPPYSKDKKMNDTIKINSCEKCWWVFSLLLETQSSANSLQYTLHAAKILKLQGLLRFDIDICKKIFQWYRFVGCIKPKTLFANLNWIWIFTSHKWKRNGKMPIAMFANGV